MSQNEIYLSENRIFESVLVGGGTGKFDKKEAISPF
jgi:hypothetical protein